MQLNTLRLGGSGERMAAAVVARGGYGLPCMVGGGAQVSVANVSRWWRAYGYVECRGLQASAVCVPWLAGSWRESAGLKGG